MLISFIRYNDNTLITQTTKNELLEAIQKINILMNNQTERKKIISANIYDQGEKFSFDSKCLVSFRTIK